MRFRVPMPQPWLLSRVAAAICFAGFFLSAGCNSGPCPTGQEIRETLYPLSNAIKQRGCVRRNEQGNYRLEGKWEFFHQNGQKEAEVSFVDGSAAGELGDTGIPLAGRSGPALFWYKTGQLMQQASYRNGQVEGPYTLWHPNGQRQAEGNYHNGLIEGALTAWHPNGQIREESNYREGVRVGEHRGYTDDGVLFFIELANGSESTFRVMNPGGWKELEFDTKSGSTPGANKRIYHSNGQLAFSATSDNVVSAFDESGRKLDDRQTALKTLEHVARLEMLLSRLQAWSK